MKTRLSGFPPQLWLVPLMRASESFSHVLYPKIRLQKCYTSERRRTAIFKKAPLRVYTLHIVLYVCVRCMNQNLGYVTHSIYIYCIFRQCIISAKLSACGSAVWKFCCFHCTHGHHGNHHAIKCRVRYA